MGAFTPTNQNNPTSVQQPTGKMGPLGQAVSKINSVAGSPMPPTQQPEMGGLGASNGINPVNTPVAQVQPQISQPGGKNGGIGQIPPQMGQPKMGQPNTYSNTVGPWDNSATKPQTQSGKGKGY